MRPLVELEPQALGSLSGLIFDLDGTLLTDGQLTPVAYAALHDLAAAGLKLVVCTGRPAAWGEVVQRQWPVDLTLTENGAIGYRTVGHGVERLDRLSEVKRVARRAELEAIAVAVRTEFPTLVMADDNLGRLSDVTFDIGERHTVPPAEVKRIRRFAERAGARTFLSSIHLHLTRDTDDKATGVVRVLTDEWQEDATSLRSRFAFIGDSSNDEACFSAFRHTFGVSNIAPHLGSMSVRPRNITAHAAGAGFAELAAMILAHRER